ncbi:hypothetical protein NT6N_05260 [Oceaniferula spumae]|uniref:Uncharacterized protein n=1 Tax=Oceaniferula spumae TaxID=2979115 RepID=A0AAT9FHN3_9BACT
MAKKKEESKEELPKQKAGCLKRLTLLVLTLLLAYFGLHVFFIWQPAGKPAEFNQQVIDANIGGMKIFPAIQAYDTSRIAGRTEIREGRSIKAPLLKARLASAIKAGYPVTLREEEINAWLSKRLALKQDGHLAPFVTARNVWVDFKQDEMEIIIERELPQNQVHMTSLFMRFDRAKNGFSISRHASHIGQVKAPGGFARLIMPAFSNLADELSEELKLYKDEGGQLKIYDIKVEDGKITLDPRRPEEREK